ncbi:hypothetical protein Pfo_026642 [Paulownia fortunei]|nr:hypothetical protein Pfo_026642 [Paulownia fortunei]
MASGQGHRNNPYNAGQDMSQAQMRRNEYVNQPSDIHNQGQATNFFQETGTQAKNMAQSAVNIAQGAAVGAANMAHGAADTVKNTLGMNAPDDTTTITGTTMNHPSSTTGMGGSTYQSTTNYPSNPGTRI